MKTVGYTHSQGGERMSLPENFLWGGSISAARCVKAAHAIDPAMQVGCMIAGCSVYPLTSDPKDVMAAYSYFQEEFCYCADTMVRGEYPSFAPRIWRRLPLPEASARRMLSWSVFREKQTCFSGRKA